MCLTVCLCLCLCLSVSVWSIGGLPVCVRLFLCIGGCIYMHLHLWSVYLRLFVSVYPFASICLLIAFVYLSASIIYLSICMRLSIASICVCLPLPLCLSGPVCLLVGLLAYWPVGNHSVCLSVAYLSVASLSVCVSVTTRLNLSVRLPTSWGRHPASLLWSSTVTPIIQPMSVRGLQVPFDSLQRSHVPWPLRQFTHAVESRVRPQFLIIGKPQTGLWTHGASILCVCLRRFLCLRRFFQTPTGYPKNWLEYFCLRSYDISYVLWIVSYVLSYVLCHLKSIWSHGFGLCLAFRT